jgi:leucyl-tRNA synthetase
MDQYIGGIEHAILHLLYARFWTRVMRDFGLVSFDEPFTRLMTQGMLLNHNYFRRTDNGGIDYFPPAEVDVQFDGDGRIVGGRLRSDGAPVEYGGVSKMSKSEKNGIDPQDLINSYGADTARMFIMFAGPPDESALWADSGVEGAQRFIKRLWAYAHDRGAVLSREQVAVDWAHAPEALRAVRRELHLVLKQADYDYRRVQYNTVVSAGMKMLNALESAPADGSAASIELVREGLSLLLRVLNPVVPHVTHALWQDLGYAARHGDIVDAAWPRVDAAALAQDEIELVLQVNGKLKGKLMVAASADKAAIEAAAIASTHVQRALAENHGGGDDAMGTVERVIVVPNRLVNVVLPRRTA